MKRRSFLGSILAAFAVRAGAVARIPIALDVEYGDERAEYFLSGFDGDFVGEKLMRIVPRETVLIDPWFDNVKMLGHFDGDFTIESWIQPITGLVSEYRVTRGVARYDNLSIAALAFPAPAAGEWTYHCILRKAGSVGRTVIPLGATATGKSA